MDRRRMFPVVLLAVALALPLTACATKGKVRISSKSMCEAHGGTYNAQTATCTPKPSAAPTAQQACVGQGGTYDAALQYCEFEAP